MRKKLTDLALKQLKKKFMSSDTQRNSSNKSDKSRHADTVIRNHVLWSMGASYMIPLPIADIFAVSALQLDMIRQLCRVYDIDFAETQGKAIVSSLTTSTLARAGARSLVKLVPGIGTLIGGITVSVFNAASTYALGEVFKRHFDNGGTILDFDTDRLRKLYNEKFEKGKRMTQRWKAEAEAETTDAPPPPTAEPPSSVVPPAATTTTTATTTQSTLARLRELGELRNQGVINDAEFEQMKKNLIDKME